MARTQANDDGAVAAVGHRLFRPGQLVYTATSEVLRLSNERNHSTNRHGPTIRTASNLVVVDVVVSDDGEPVKGLQREAFHIFEGGL